MYFRYNSAICWPLLLSMSLRLKVTFLIITHRMDKINYNFTSWEATWYCLCSMCSGDAISRLVSSTFKPWGTGGQSTCINLFSNLFLMIKACGLLWAFFMNSRTYILLYLNSCFVEEKCNPRGFSLLPWSISLRCS